MLVVVSVVAHLLTPYSGAGLIDFPLIPILVSPPQFASHSRQRTAFKERQVDGVAYRTAILLGKELQVSSVTGHVRIGWQILEKRVADKHHKLASRPGQRHIESSRA